MTTIVVDYGQFYVRDSGAEIPDGSGISAEVLRMHAGRGTDDWAAVLIASQYREAMPVTVAVVSEAPDMSDSADHVVDFSLHVPSGHLELVEWGEPDAKHSTEVPADWVRVRVSWFDLTVDEGETVDIAVWSSTDEPAQIVRQWSVWDEPEQPGPTADGRRRYSGYPAYLEAITEHQIGMVARGEGTNMLMRGVDDSLWEFSMGGEYGSIHQLEELTPADAEARYPDHFGAH